MAEIRPLDTEKKKMIVYAFEVEDIDSKPWFYNDEMLAKIVAGKSQRDNVQEMYPDIPDKDIHFVWKQEGKFGPQRMYLQLTNAFWVPTKSPEYATTFILYPVEVFEVPNI